MNTLKRNGFAWAALALMTAGSVYAWGRLPQQLPVHWGIDGQPDRFGGRLEALGIFPLVCLLLYALALFLPQLTKQSEANRRLTRAIVQLVIGGLAALHFALIANHLGAGLSVPRVAGLVVGVILMGTGNLLPKVEPNRWLGVRTPWTFRSKASWHKTQRAGGWVLSACGAAFFLTALLSPSTAALAAVTGVTLIGVLFLTVYSYRVWRDDAHPEPSL